jgi:hypothetical protein
LLPAALSGIGRQHSNEDEQPPSLVIVALGRPPPGWLLRRTVTDGSRLLLHPADGTSRRAPDERLNHRARRSSPSRERRGRTPIIFRLASPGMCAPLSTDQRVLSHFLGLAGSGQSAGGRAGAGRPRMPGRGSSSLRGRCDLATPTGRPPVSTRRGGESRTPQSRSRCVLWARGRAAGRSPS